MQTFQNVLGHWQARRLSALEAAEMLSGASPLPAPLRGRCLDGLFDRRLDKARAPRAGRPDRMGARAVPNPPCGLDGQALPRPSARPPRLRLELHLDQDHPAARSLVSKAPRRGAHRRRRPRKPCVGMMLHQDGSRHEWLAGQAACDLIVTMDDATSEIYSAFLVEEEGTASTFRALKQVFTVKGMPSSLYTDRGSHYFHTPEAGGKVAKDQHTQVGRALHQLGIEHIAAYSPEARGRPSAPSAPSRTASSRNWRWRGSQRSKPPTASSQTPTCPTTTAASRPRPSSTTAPSCPSNTPARSTTSSVAAQSARSPATTPCRKARPPNPRPRPDTTASRPRWVHESGRNPRPLPRAPNTAHGEPIETPTRVRVRRFANPPAPCGQVDSRSAPDHFPTGPTDRSGQMMCYLNRPNTLASDTPANTGAFPFARKRSSNLSLTAAGLWPAPPRGRRMSGGPRLRPVASPSKTDSLWAGPIPGRGRVDQVSFAGLAGLAAVPKVGPGGGGLSLR